MKLNKILAASMLALSALSCTAAPVMANTNSIVRYNQFRPVTFNTTLDGADVKLGTVELQNMIAANHNGGGSYYRYHLTFLVKNNGYNKTIVVHSQENDRSTEWCDSEPATYVKTLEDGTEVWELSETFQSGTKFCVWYKELNSWDNNNGADYNF